MKKKVDCLKLVNYIENSSDFKNRILSCRKILIAYSGGQDSSALLALFYILSKKWQFSIGVVYCNHGWTTSMEAHILIFEKIENLALPFYFIDAKQPIKPENMARNWRYSAFTHIMKNSDYDLLLTGHTLSDCAETIIFNLCRGSGLKGVCSLRKFQVFQSEKESNFLFEIKNFSLSYLTNNKSNNISMFEKFFYSRLNKPFFDKRFSYLLYHYYLINQKQVLQVDSSLKIISPVKSVITFFDPISYLLIKKLFFNTTPTYFCSQFIYSLFSKPVFSLAKPLVSQYQLQTFQVCNSRPITFYIQSGIATSELSFKKLLVRKLKERKFINDNYTFKLNFLFLVKQPSSLLVDNHSFSKRKTSFTERLKRSQLSDNQFKLFVYRPFIPITRQTIFRFGQELKLTILYDISNNDLHLTRNLIRTIVLPTLKYINPKVEQNLYKFSQIILFYLEHVELKNENSNNIEIFKP